jgi:septal ring factor EnvC (AmiA/AmiB activator)
MRAGWLFAVALAGLAGAGAWAQNAGQAQADDRRGAPRSGRCPPAGRCRSKRADKLEADAQGANAAADRTAHEAAAIAARIQQAEAEIAVDEARIRLIDQQRAALSATLARRQQPLLRLTGALQHLSRRPMIVSLLRPGSVNDAAHLRALLATMVPEVSAAPPR